MADISTSYEAPALLGLEDAATILAKTHHYICTHNMLHARYEELYKNRAAQTVINYDHAKTLKDIRALAFPFILSNHSAACRYDMMCKHQQNIQWNDHLSDQADPCPTVTSRTDRSVLGLVRYLARTMCETLSSDPSQGLNDTTGLTIDQVASICTVSMDQPSPFQRVFLSYVDPGMRWLEQQKDKVMNDYCSNVDMIRSEYDRLKSEGSKNRSSYRGPHSLPTS